MVDIYHISIFIIHAVGEYKETNLYRKKMKLFSLVNESEWKALQFDERKKAWVSQSERYMCTTATQFHIYHILLHL